MSANAVVLKLKRLADKRTLRKRKGVLIAVASLAMVAWATPLGLLLWARIRILTSIPKTAIADDTLASAPRNEPPPDLDPALPGPHAALRDPFHVDQTVFPELRVAAPAVSQGSRGQAGGAAATSVASVATDPNSSQSGDATGEVSGPSAIELARASAETFRVQSAGAGLVTAVIDDKVRRIGEVLTSSDGRAFKLVKVIDHGVVLSHEGQEFVVRMPVEQTGEVSPTVPGASLGSNDAREGETPLPPQRTE